ncbi:MerR family transcriptional regulator [Chitinimonas naiadis]
MQLKIGELAKRTGVTIRALRHYDDIGLLSPSGRSDAGYRLYNQRDVARLYQILALRQLGLPLADIGPLLTGSGMALPSLIDRQFQALDARIAETVALRDRLGRLRTTLAQHHEPELDEWLSTMERMTMYDKYFTQAEQEELKGRADQADIRAAEAEWPTLIATAQQLLDAGTPPEGPQVQALATRWRTLVLQFTGANAALLPKLHTMYHREDNLQAQTGLNPALMAYIGRAQAVSRFAIYARYLDETEMIRFRANYGTNMSAWPALIAIVHRLMQAQVPSDHPDAKAAAAQWHSLTESFAGSDPRTREKMRTAMENEPALLEGTGINLAMLDYLRAAHTGVADQKHPG